MTEILPEAHVFMPFLSTSIFSVLGHFELLWNVNTFFMLACLCFSWWLVYLFMAQQ